MSIAEIKRDKKLKRFVFISLIMFALILGLTGLYAMSCIDGNCNDTYIYMIATIIFITSLFGLLYCILITREFKNDEVIKDLKDIEKD